MSLQFKLIIPLLDENITLEDISLTTGFIGAYNEDINHPYMDHHIFLLYSNEIMTMESIECQKKLSKLPTLCSRRNLKINGHTYCSFAFVMNNTIRKLTSNIGTLTHKERCRINSFWKGQDEEVSNYLMEDDSFLTFKSKNHTIPQEDYIPQEDEYNKKPGLSVKRTRVNFFQ